MLNPGKYKARAISFNFGETPQKKEFVAVLFEVALPGGQMDRITHYMHFATPENIEISTRQLRAAGWDGRSPNMSGLGEVDCEIVIVADQFNGQTKNVVRYVNDLLPPVKTPLDAKRARAFMERIIAQQPPATSGAPNGPAGTGGDDEIPF